MFDPARLVFIDETATSTNMVRLWGRCRRGERLVGFVPHGHWKTITLVAGLRQDGMVAPFVIDGPMNDDRHARPHLFLRNPTWQVMYDIDPLRAAETRKKFYDMASAEKALIQGFHFPFPSAGYVEKETAQYRLVPIPWNPTI